MDKNCETCEFFDIDYKWDEESGDDIYTEQCQCGNDEWLKKSGSGCPFFKKFETSVYIEVDGKCDKCTELTKCVASGACIEITALMHSRRHYTKGMGVICDF